MAIDKNINHAEYWRDLCIKVLSWGVASSIIIIGWSMSSGELFCFDGCPEYEFRAISYVAILILVSGLWIFSIHFLYNKAIKITESEGLQILKESSLISIAILWSFLTISIAFATGLMCEDDLIRKNLCPVEKENNSNECDDIEIETKSIIKRVVK